MSASSARRADPAEARAAAFAALGDGTRLALVGKLSRNPSQSIARLAEGSTLTRQAIAKHLRVLEGAGLVEHVRAGREARFALRPKPLHELRTYLDEVSAQWDDALLRLKSYVED
jgi:DNA-binding transcriptional ArsR family regulator